MAKSTKVISASGQISPSRLKKRPFTPLQKISIASAISAKRDARSGRISSRWLSCSSAALTSPVRTCRFSLKVFSAASRIACRIAERSARLIFSSSFASPPVTIRRAVSSISANKSRCSSPSSSSLSSSRISTSTSISNNRCASENSGKAISLLGSNVTRLTVNP